MAITSGTRPFPAGPSRALAPLLLVCSLLSGLACLVHETAWNRLFTLVIGSSADSAALILATFMAGLGLGAHLAGRRAARLRRPLLIFAALQLLVALWGLLLPASSGNPLLVSWTTLVARESTALRWLLRALFSLLFVLPPTLFMGASLPLLVQRFSPRETGAPSPRLPSAAAGLVATNTLGACAGTLVAGYWLIPLLGTRASILAGCAANAAAALLALAAPLLPGRAAPRPATPAPTPAAPGGGAPLLAVSFLLGFFLLAMEIVWRRVLVMSFGHDTYGFSAMLFSVIAGMAIGNTIGYCVTRYAARGAGRTLRILLPLLALSAPLCLLAARPFLMDSSAGLLGLAATPSTKGALRGGLLGQLVTSALVVLLPSLLSGACFTLLFAGREGATATESSTTTSTLGNGMAGRTGRILLANYAGGVAGVAVTALFLVGAIGIRLATGAICAAAAAAAGLAFHAGGPRRATRAVLLAAATLAAALALYPPGLTRELFLRTAGGSHLSLQHYREGRTSTVGVTRDPVDGERQLLINGVNEVTDRFVHDQSFALLGHLGFLLHPAPRKALVISYGGGLTAGAAATHGSPPIEVADLEKGVLEASRAFGDLNMNALDRGRLAVAIEDGRFRLASSPGAWDLVIVDSTHPRSVDSWLLYTREFYETAARKLAGSGILVQWVPLHGMSVSEYKIILASFLSAFPEGQLWANYGYDARGFVGYSLLVGSPSGAVAVDMERVAARLAAPAVRASLARWLLDTPEEIADCFVAGAPALKRWTAGVPVATDDRPVIPFVTAWSRGSRLHPAALTALLSRAGAPLALAGSSPAAAQYAAGAEARFLTLGRLLRGDVEGALENDPGSRLLKRYVKEKQRAVAYYIALARRPDAGARLLVAAARSLRGLGALDEAEAALGRAQVAAPGDAAILFERALCREAAQDDGGARALYWSLLEREPGSVPAKNNLALLLSREGKFGRALSLLMQSRREDPSHAPTWVALGRVRAAMGEHAAALDAFRQALELDQDDPRVFDHIGGALAALGRTDEAIRFYRLAWRLDPFWDAPPMGAGEAALQARRPVEAREWFTRALAAEPKDADAWLALGVALHAEGKPEEAASALLVALSLDPESDRGWLSLGFVYKELGKEELAKESFAQALALNPGLSKAILSGGPAPPAGPPGR